MIMHLNELILSMNRLLFNSRWIYMRWISAIMPISCHLHSFLLVSIARASCYSSLKDSISWRFIEYKFWYAMVQEWGCEFQLKCIFIVVLFFLVHLQWIYALSEICVVFIIVIHLVLGMGNSVLYFYQWILKWIVGLPLCHIVISSW